MPLNKVLILTNPLNHEGGVVNYYNLFLKHFKSNVIALKHGSIGSRSYLFYYPVLKRLLYPFYYIFDVVLYVLRLLFDREIKIVQVSPSLIPVPLLRDGLLVILAKLLGKRVIVFYRGWKLPTLKRLNNNKVLKTLFNFIFQKNTTQVVLASAFKKDLNQINTKYKTKIIVTTTAIDKNQIVRKNTKKKTAEIDVLFLGRIQDLKGIGELIEAICKLEIVNKLHHFNFTIVGHEFKVGYVQSLKEKLKVVNINDDKVKFTGRKTGIDKFNIYSENDIYVLPSYTEGCPNSVLEALSTGLFCITTSVGALHDIIKPEQNGLLVKQKSVDSIVSALLYCIENKTYLQQSDKISKSSIEKFDIRKIVSDFEAIYCDLIPIKIKKYNEE